ncbi:spore coat protein U domain-containing protein [Halobacteriovorax sp. HLS]|uniref:spore coat protein U domain-containing protein n=1 Tax=Halobacteriovorax sp. HLS TaxID=2234000 RepID=UPI000FD7FB0A|nr:spore coat protein U domain-containing protein [Halobacteriovorax sp. HLS]
MKFLILLLTLFSTHAMAVNCPMYAFVNSVNFVQMQADQSVAVDIDLYRFTSHNDCKKYSLGITTGSASSYSRKLYNAQHSVSYNFHENESTSKVIKDLDDGNNSEHVSINFKNSYYQRVTVYARMPNPYSNGNLQTGLYSDNVTINIRPTKNGTTGGVSRSVSLYLNIQSDLNISLVEKGGAFNENSTFYSLSFIPMVGGQTKGMHLIVKSNSGYRITVSSENDGRLTHVNKPNGNTVDYTFSVNGVGRSLIGSLNNPDEIFYSPVASPNDGDVIDIDVTIDSVINKLSGTYRDHIYFNAISTH